MKPRAADVLLKPLIDPKTGIYDVANIAALDDDTKATLVNHFVSTRRAIVEEFIGAKTDMSWLASCGYGYRFGYKGFKVNGTQPHKISADAGTLHIPYTVRPMKPQKVPVKSAAWLDTISDISFDEDTKEVYHKSAKAALRQLAKDLGLGTDDFSLRSNLAGPAVCGEVMLHADKLFVQISADHHSIGTVLYRNCKNRKDSTGGQNLWCKAAALKTDSILNTMRNIIR